MPGVIYQFDRFDKGRGFSHSARAVNEKLACGLDEGFSNSIDFLFAVCKVFILNYSMDSERVSDIFLSHELPRNSFLIQQNTLIGKSLQE
jgi:hypothetical protein